jgi:hypothetical protein
LPGCCATADPGVRALGRDDREDPVDDNVWGEAAEHFSATELAGLLVGVAVI